MASRIKREDLDHLLRLIETGVSEDIAARGAGKIIAERGLSSAHVLAPGHVLWSKNHEFWVDKLKTETAGSWTDDQYSSAATIINTAEYQHVVFSKVASALTSGLAETHDRRTAFGAEHHAGHASAAAAIPADLFDETVDLLDASTGQVSQVNLATVLDESPGPSRPNGNEPAGAEAQQAGSPEVLRSTSGNDLTAKSLDLGALTGARTRDSAHVPFNQVRCDLFAQLGLSTLLPYASWEDFQARNGLSDQMMAELKSAYPEGFSTLDLWVGGLAERPTVGDLGPTIAAAVHEEITRLRDESALSCVDLLAGTQIAQEISTQSLSDIIVRNTGAEQLVDDVLAELVQEVKAVEAEHVAINVIHGTDGDDVLIGTDLADKLIGGLGDDLLDGGPGADILVGGPGNDTYVVDDVHDRIVELTGDGDGDTVLTSLNAFALVDDATDAVQPSSDVPLPETPIPIPVSVSTAGAVDPPANPPPVVELPPSFGTAVNVENLTYTGDGRFTGAGNSADNVIVGGGGNDNLWGGGGDDTLYGGGGNDFLQGGTGNDLLFGGAGSNRFDGGEGDDTIYSAAARSGMSRPASNSSVYTQDHDTIVLRPGFGNDVVIGFDTRDGCHGGRDRLDVSAYGSLSAESIGKEILISSLGAHTVITIHGDTVTLLDVNSNAIGRGDFIFS